MRLLVIDGNAAFSAALAALLAAHGHEVAGHATDAAGGLGLARSLAPEAVLVALPMTRGPGGAALLEGLRAARAVLIVLGLHRADTCEPATAAYRYVQKDRVVEDLLPLLARLPRGGSDELKGEE